MANIIVSGLFTSATQTAYDIYAYLSSNKRYNKYNIELAPHGTTSCSDCDLLICGSYATLLKLKEYLNTEMVVIVSDGPLIVSCLSTATPLDYTRRHSYKFEFKAPNYELMLPSLKHEGPQVALLADEFDVLGLVTSHSVTGGLILQELTKVQSYFDALARNRLRFLFIEVLTAEDYKTPLKALNEFLKSECTNPEHRADATAFWTKFTKGGAAKVLRQAMKNREGKNIGLIAKKFNLSQYELTYIIKMIRNLDTAAARTESYAARTKTMQKAV